MKRYLLAASAALVLVACHKQADTSAVTASDASAASSAVTDTASTAAPDGTPNASAAAAAAAPAGPEFVAKAAASDMYEIQAAKIAQTRSKNADIKAFAKMMVMDHTKSTASIKRAIVQSGHTDLSPPADLPDDKKAMIDALNKASDADFDKTYVDQQVMAHNDALALMTAYSMSGDVAQLKDAAGAIVPTVQGHLDKITAIQASMAK
jgi:putative membrane protein